MELKESLAQTKKPFGDVPPAPKKFQDAWNENKDTLAKQTIERSEIDYRLDMAA